VIINAAAYTAVDRAESEPDVAMAINGKAVGVIAEEAQRIDAWLIHYSTDFVFGGGGTRPWREDDPPSPLNIYGKTKLAGELAIRNTRARHLIIRTAWVYGRTGISFIRKLLVAGHGRPELSVVDDQVGVPTSARFVAKITAQIVEGAIASACLVSPISGTLHVACAGEASRWGIAREVFRQLREIDINSPDPSIRRVQTSSLQSAARRPLNSRLDTSRMRAIPGVESVDWRDELRQHLPSIWKDVVEDRTAACRDPYVRT
jgi:dTDP-4-dehydrorhamnose reductase